MTCRAQSVKVPSKVSLTAPGLVHALVIPPAPKAQASYYRRLSGTWNKRSPRNTVRIQASFRVEANW